MLFSFECNLLKVGFYFDSKIKVVAKKLKSTLFWRLFFQTHLRLPLPLIKLRYGSVWPQGDLTHFVVQYNVDPGPVLRKVCRCVTDVVHYFVVV